MYTLRDLMGGHKYAEIVCPVKNIVVRRIVVVDDTADVDFTDGTKLGIKLDAELSYQPWFWDRGSVLVDQAEHGRIKLCTEADRIDWDDGSSGCVSCLKMRGFSRPGMGIF